MQEEKEVVNEEAKAAEQSEEAKTEQDAAKAEKKYAKEAEKEDKKSAKFGKKKKIEELEEEIVKLKEEAAANKNAYFKAYADTENLKKRLQSESDNVRKYRIQSFAMEILPVLDNLERALDVKVDDQNVKNYAKGFEMIYQQLVHILNQEGVKEREALEKPFDPNFHQAVMTVKDDNFKTNMIVEELQKGYKLKDRVIRASLVKVSE